MNALLPYYNRAVTALEHLHRELLDKVDTLFEIVDERSSNDEKSDELDQLWDDHDTLEYEAGVVQNLLYELNEIADVYETK